MKAIVLISFSDKANNVVRQAGKVIDISEERFEEIMAANDKLIKAVEDKEGSSEFPKHVGGGNYELSNGEKIKGKEAVLKAQAELEAAGNKEQ
jgi:phage antirepressor YoqD-like protein